MFKVFNKDTRMTPCSSIFIAYCEHVIGDYEYELSSPLKSSKDTRFYEDFRVN